jgi:predicted nucleic acid-binding protein
MIVVADTSPINYLILIGHIDILPHFYGQILTPPSVWQELHDIDAPEAVRAWVKATPPWLELSPLDYVPDPSLSFLDRGEQEAIALAEQRHAERLIVDEMLARREAIRRNLSVIGTLGVLRNAARANPLRLPEALANLQETSFYAAPELIRSLLDEETSRLSGKRQ